MQASWDHSVKGSALCYFFTLWLKYESIFFIMPPTLFSMIPCGRSRSSCSPSRPAALKLIVPFFPKFHKSNIDGKVGRIIGLTLHCLFVQCMMWNIFADFIHIKGKWQSC